jgi:glutaconate CoA-transferase subunit B
MTDGTEYNMMELMICVCPRYLEEGRTVAVGTGPRAPRRCSRRKSNSPNLVILFEAAAVAPQCPSMPILGGDYSLSSLR